MKLVSQNRCDLIVLSHARDDAGSDKKHTLETIDRTVRQACKDGIAVVDSGADQACNKSDGTVSGQRMTN